MSGIAPGVYTLNVIANLPNSDDRAAYETILVILSLGQSQQDPTQVIQRFKLVTDIWITFEEVENDNECSNNLGSAGLTFPYDKKSECEFEDWNKCKNDAMRGIKWDDFCKDLNHGFSDDCEGFANKEECDEYWSQNPEPLPCDENTSPDTLCRDEGDYDTCDEGYVDRGYGCEPEDKAYYVNCEEYPLHVSCHDDTPEIEEPDQGPPVPQICPPRCGDNENEEEKESEDKNSEERELENEGEEGEEGEESESEDSSEDSGSGEFFS